MNLNFAKKLDFLVYKTKVDAQKIDKSKLDIFGIVLASFSINNKEERTDFFKKTFLLTDISIDIALKMFFFTLNNVEIDFVCYYIH